MIEKLEADNVRGTPNVSVVLSTRPGPLGSGLGASGVGVTDGTCCNQVVDPSRQALV